MAGRVDNYAPNRHDTPAQRRFAFPGASLTNKMIQRFINIPYFDPGNARRNKFLVIMCYASGRCKLEGWNVRANSRTLAALEFVAPNLPDACFSQTGDARKMFISALFKFLGGRLTNSYIRRPEDDISFAEATCQDAAVQAMIRRFPTNEDNLPETLEAFVLLMRGEERRDVINDDYDASLAQALALVFDRLCDDATTELRAGPTAMYACLYIGLGKRGTVTEEKLNSLNEAIRLETNFDVRVSNEEVQAVGSNMSPYVDEVNARVIMEGIATSMDTYSLRLKILMNQTAKSGMTSYWAIRDAFTRYRDFPWNVASGLIGQDFINFDIAVRLVGNNEYYGFKKSLGDAAHSKYLSLGWLCCALLIKNNPEEYGNLKAYRGTTTNPARKDQLQALIDDYVPQQNEEPLDNIENILAQCRLGNPN